MTDLDLLRQYAPVLCFHKSERFYPMRVEDYLDGCRMFTAFLWHRDVTRKWQRWGSGDGAKPEGSERLTDNRYYLRFGTVEGWTGQRLMHMALLVGLVMTGSILLHFPTVWLWIILWAGLLLLLGCSIAYSRTAIQVVTGVLVSVAFLFPAWLTFGNQVSDIVEGLGLIVPAVWVVVLFSRNYIGHVPSFLVELFSRATDGLAQDVADRYKNELLDKRRQCTCYGRVVREEQWTVLQYHFFYAFNDWRSRAGGLNNHEADWEMVAVFLDLRTFEPRALACSAHHKGLVRQWHDIHPEDLAQGQHPIVYAALGSHANYPVKGEKPLPELYQSGRIHKALHIIETWITLWSERLADGGSSQSVGLDLRWHLLGG